MNNVEIKEKRCKSCGKLLVDEKLPFCRRCVLEGRNKVGEIGTVIVGLATAFIGVKALANNNADDNDYT